ncbi:UNC-50 family protein [Schizosaccharomyces cryophilus OY26]|uniref:UNC-50 family protein n=1 Tax=Schizosaccharomyces cryophilus (strain OY26 / ATCC MYA-4695 / CBS 11777 / NBRC 106824 / NRRL Y48691) TaxID=653667 RepID=S9VRY0_SCHCR|nr:UNC-50 family protein [Schizosaccharomyces cryophilus OY26]EPY50698.1 UNC-50 family protein [Schizosaccharomyces cryophilus OY26]
MSASVHKKLRSFKLSQMDLERSLWDMVNLFRAPRRVYRSISLRKQTINQYGREDLSFIILFSGLIVFTSFCWAFFFENTLKGYISLLCSMLFVDFLAVGFILSSIYYFVAKKFLLKDIYRESVTLGPFESQLEWKYCFDIHCNSFFPVFVLLYILQLILLPLISRSNFISLFLGNSLYLVALCYYTYLTFIGYQTLPFLKDTHTLLTPIPMFLIMWALSLLGYNVPKHVVSVYFKNDA